MRTLIGKAPIHPVAFAVGKLAIAPPYILLLAWAFGLRPAVAMPAAIRAAAIVLVAAGLLLVVMSSEHLGRSLRIGLPTESTELKTHGLYRFSRNPIYVGVFLAAVGLCLLVPHWINLASTAVMIAVHHRIVLAEERFLERRFGQAWIDYRAAARRYI